MAAEARNRLAASLAVEHGNDPTAHMSEILAPFASEDMDDDRIMANVFAVLQADIAAGLCYEQELIALRRHYTHDNKCKRMAMAFIIDKGMADDFRDYLNDHAGDDVGQTLGEAMARLCK